jgi:hypothetical protein
MAELMEEPDVEVNHANIYRLVQKLTQQLEAFFRIGKKRPGGKRVLLDYR